MPDDTLPQETVNQQIQERGLQPKAELEWMRLKSINFGKSNNPAFSECVIFGDLLNFISQPNKYEV